MPMTTLLDMPQEEQAQLLAALRRARYGSLLALYVLLLCAAQQMPSEMAASLWCSCSSSSRLYLFRHHLKRSRTTKARRLSSPLRFVAYVCTR